MRGSLRRIPAVKISKDRPGCGAVDIVQQPVVQRRTGIEALLCTLRLAFFVCAQQIGGIIAQQVCRNTGRALDVRRYAHCTRGKDGLFAHGLFGEKGNDPNQLPGIVQTQLVAHLKAVVPAGGRKLALPDKLLVIGGKCL